MLEFNIDGWLTSSLGDPLEKETLGYLRIAAGPNHFPVTEVDDTLAGTVRPHIAVPAYLVARWLLVHWWRLRWEPLHERPSLDWLHAHSLAAIGGGYAWPALTFSSDGEFIHLRQEAEASPDASAIRYLRDVALDVPAADFERAVERFLDKIETRLAARVPDARELSELREELRQERSAAELSGACKLQALAGLDPGSAADDWLRAANALVVRAGRNAAEEVLAVVPTLQGGLQTADATISAMRDSAVTVKLPSAAPVRAPTAPAEVPWVRGVELAHQFRVQQGIPSGPISRELYQQLLGVRMPLPRSSWTGQRHLLGGYRNGTTDGRTALLVTKAREDSQRFYLARLIGAALTSSADQHVLPVSDAGTAFQKLERSFAQEFLCPWEELDAFTDESGTGDDGIAEAAERYMVSERLVLSTLVNREKIPRSRLQM